MTEIEQKIRSEFPLFANRDMVYLDNSATSQRPQVVIDAVSEFYEKNNANPLRGLYELSVDATEAYENARADVARFIHASRPEEIVFTRNATESLNLIAYAWGDAFLGEGDEIVVSIAEHHSNILPWQQVAKRTGAKLVWFDCTADGELAPEKLKELVNEHTKIVAVTQISNVFGRLNDVKAYAEIAHSVGALYVCDGAQSVPHIPVDVQDLDVDFLVFSGHKMFAPMGIGALYAKYELLEKMPPFLTGGEMIEYVTRDGATYAEIPHKFEAGTVNAAGAVGFGAAIRYMESYGWDVIEERERELSKYMMEKITEVPHVHVLGSKDAEDHHGIFTFTIDGVHPHDVAAIFDAANIGVRAGHHCTQPLHKYLHEISTEVEVVSTTRASLAFYNTKEDIDAFIECLATVRSEMGYGA